MSHETPRGDDPFDEAALLAELATALAAPAVPAEIRSAARAVYTWRTIDAELARITYDSTDTELAGSVRGAVADLRTLVFATPGTTIALELGPRELLGQVSPVPAERSCAARVETTDGRITEVGVDEFGCFTVSPVPRERFRLLLEVEGSAPVVTDWVTL